MNRPRQAIPWQALLSDRPQTTRDAICMACVLEASAPKAGNVHPQASFGDLNYQHFVDAAEILAKELTRTDITIAKRMRSAVIRSRESSGTNVNLGIVLLIGPLVDANVWDEGNVIFDCIRIAGAGGLSQVDEMDVNDIVDQVDLRAAMESAADRDDIALQYATDFRDLREHIVPVVDNAINEIGDPLSGIAEAHLRILSTRPDSLIARKNGIEVARDVMRRAQVALAGDIDTRQQFDAFLRDETHRLNPGTTADLIAASLFLLLRPTTTRTQSPHPLTDR